MSDTTVLIRIVDDDEEFAASQKMLIESLGWEVVTYASATEFLAEDALERPGCLILDVRMPVMTGLELQQELEKRMNRVVAGAADQALTPAVEAFHRHIRHTSTAAGQVSSRAHLMGTRDASLV